MQLISAKDHPMKRLHLLTSNNKELILIAEEGLCIHCRTYLKPSEISWIEDGITAVCPKCQVDAVIPAMTTKLKAAFSEWMFSKN